MTATWQDDKRWSDRFIPEIKRILGEHLIGESTEEEDGRHNTDLIVLKLEAVRIACRIRRHEYFDRYPDEFTIRSGRPSGVETELTKVVAGWGDYFFYGFSDEREVGLRAWSLCDLKVFRLWFNRCLYSKKHEWQERANGDNSSTFHAFKLSALPPGFIVARSK